MGACAIVSFRLGLSDGVSIVASTWQQALEDRGWETYTVAGEGPVTELIEGLAIDAAHPPDRRALMAALAPADVVVVENMLTIPMNLGASRMLTELLADRPAVLHHHDPPWQRARYAHLTELPPTDPAWRHVTINKLTQRQFEQRGLAATTIYNGFDPDPSPGDRDATRRTLGIDPDRILATHPVRAIARKNIAGAVDLAEKLGAVYWLPNPAEEGYDGELARILSAARCEILRHPIRGTDLAMADLYAATDLVVFPSLWEGFGNPPIEAALHRRPAAVGDYPVATELRAMGFQWFDPADAGTIAEAMKHPSTDILDRNQRIARERLSVQRMGDEVQQLFELAGWKP